MFTSSSPLAAIALAFALTLTLTAFGCGFDSEPLQEGSPDPDQAGKADDGSSDGDADRSGGDSDGSGLTGAGAGGGASGTGSSGNGAGGSSGSGADGGASDDEPADDEPNDDEPSDSGKDAGDGEPEPVFGLKCGGVKCPAVPAGNDQCCTADADVSGLRARELEQCGIDLPASDGCFELEQPGVLDDSCPDHATEPGCCTPGGRCGTVNGPEGIGCHVDGSVEQACGGPVDDTTTCDTTGWFALRADIDVTWGGRSGALLDLTDDGRGTIVVDLLAKIPAVDDSGEFESEIRACAATLPPFVSTTLCERYQALFPTRVWDSDAGPSFSVPGKYECDNPGCVLGFDGFTGVVGIELDDPDGAWPSADKATSFSCPSGSGLDCYPDHDDDGQPGVRVELVTSGTSAGSGSCSSYRTRAAPLNANPLAIIGGVRRTDRIDLGVRLRMGAAGRLADDCGGAEGIGLAEFVQSRAARCMAQEGTNNPFQLPAGANTPCTSAELTFVNQSLPDYDALALGESPSSALTLSNDDPSPGPRYRIVRLHGLSDAASCADARAALDAPP